MPVITRRTVAERVNSARLTANAIEAAEQCCVLWVPEVAEPEKQALFSRWDKRGCSSLPMRQHPSLRHLPHSKRKPRPARRAHRAGGWVRGGGEDAPLDSAFVLPISLGPRVMRADTAAVAALSLVNATLGDWRS